MPPITRAQAERSRHATSVGRAAAELPWVELHDALAPCLLVADDPRRYQRAAARWHARFRTETAGIPSLRLESLGPTNQAEQQYVLLDGWQPVERLSIGTFKFCHKISLT
jgi:hypothetical protein